MRNKSFIFLFWLCFAVSAQAVMVSRTIMVYQPETLFGAGLQSISVREANASITPPSKSSDWWSVTFTKDSSQYNFEFNQNNYDVFFQLFVGENSNQCFDMNGWRRSDQNCTAKFLNMGKWPNDTMWIVPDLSDALYKPDTFFTRPVFKTFYFLPPDNDEWNRGRAQAVIGNGAPVNMLSDDRDGTCGWYMMRYVNANPPTDVYFVLGGDNDIQIGQNGIEEDMPAHIDLKAMFESLGSDDVYFEADGGSSGWSSAYMGGNGSCGYSLAALVYDSDASMHGAFSCDAYPMVGANGCYTAGVSWPDKSFEEGTIPCMGVKKGVVGSVLDQGKKPMYNAASGCFESAAKFQQLFSETPGVNVKHCVDLNLSRSKNGYWKYDSMDEKDQGFFPLEWESNSGAGTKRVAYGGMAYGVGNDKQIANSDALAMKVSSWAALDAATGLPFIDLYPAQDGEFDTGDNPNVYDNSFWDKRMGRAGTVGSEAYKGGDMKKNQHFCMESHATFEYQRGQFLSLRGDDDIWAYIDNRLAIDLGGMHLPAPGLVYLDTMGLVEGTKYDLDIFLCDRRTDMSNLSIKTNLYFNQSQGLFTQEAANDAATLEICKQSGSTSSCDALLSGTSSEVICGDKLASELRYFLTSGRAGDTLWLSDTNKNCSYADGVLTCYGGLKIGAGKVSVDKSKIQGLAGTYIAWAQLTDPINPLKVRITKFSADSSASPPSKKITLKAAILKPDTSKCGTDAAHPCLDKLYALFSEPVISLDEAGFSYYSASHKAWGEAWKPVTCTLQDTVATLVFLRYTGIESPQAGDSLRLKPESWTGQAGNNVQVLEEAVVLRALPGTTPVMPVSQSSIGWRQALSATQGRVWLRDLQGRALWSASLPVSPAQVRAQVALQGRLCLLHIGERAWLVNF